jgi:CsoR family transcriptional regulator, copper-sensing transcriptional repressor
MIYRVWYPLYNRRMEVSADVREEVIHRLRRIEGQVRGVQGMIEGGMSCKKVASQVKAARTALDAVGKLILACYLAESLKCNSSEREAIDMIVKF